MLISPHGPFEAEVLDGEVELVAGCMTGVAHGLLVERRIDDAIDGAALAGIEQERERVEHFPPGVCGDVPDGRIDGAVTVQE